MSSPLHQVEYLDKDHLVLIPVIRPHLYTMDAPSRFYNKISMKVTHWRRSKAGTWKPGLLDFP